MKNYRSRQEPQHHDDRALKDEWQKEVYAYALQLMTREGGHSVGDFGCGSGYKLMKYFSEFDTTGYELEPALSHLKDLYPDRNWRAADGASATDLDRHDLVICSDVVEHMTDPDVLLHMLAKCKAPMILLSTPALDILADRGRSPRLGPPRNVSHVREWSTAEFAMYVGQHLPITEHIVINCRQATQVVYSRR